MNLTPFIRSIFEARLKQMHRYVDYGEWVQREILEKLVGQAAYTEFGLKYKLGNIKGYNDFRSSIPLHTYADLEPHIRRMMRGSKNILWPGVCKRFAQSSGTSGQKSKYIPITNDSLKHNHFRGATDVVVHYLNMNPDSQMFSGKGFILGGSFATEATGMPKSTKVGDLSASLIECINPLANFMRVPKKSIALMEDWKKKVPALVDASIKQNVTNISGVPSWFLTVLQEVLKKTGAKTIHEVWPNLEVFFHGGICFEPYRAQYEQICDMSKMHFVETYNASEGFFATQSSFDSQAMLLLLDVGVFYEFIPIKESESKFPNVLPMWSVKQGEVYELVITSCNGLWRYRIGDTVRIEQLNPLKISIVGRTKSFLNAFGEELMVFNADNAIAHAAVETDSNVANYTAAPVFPADGKKGRHQWLIEFNREPADLNKFAQALDKNLKAENSDYEAKRTGDIFLDMPEIVVAKPGLFDQWLGQSGKLGGQRKVIRLSNSRKFIEELLALNS